MAGERERGEGERPSPLKNLAGAIREIKGKGETDEKGTFHFRGSREELRRLANDFYSRVDGLRKALGEKINSHIKRIINGWGDVLEKSGFSPEKAPKQPRKEERPKGPIKRPELKLDSWMTDEGDKAKPEVVEPREWKEGIPNYGEFDNINQVVYAVRQQLNDAIMRNGWIRPDEAEGRAIRDWLTEAKNLAKEAGGRGTREWRISKDLEKEHQAIREMLAWWHDGVLSHVEPAGRGFEQMQNRGTDFTADRING